MNPFDLPIIEQASAARREGLILPRPRSTTTVLVENAENISDPPIVTGYYFPFDEPISIASKVNRSVVSVQIPEDSHYCQVRVMSGEEVWCAFSSLSTVPANNVINEIAGQTVETVNAQSLSSTAIYFDSFSRDLFAVEKSNLLSVVAISARALVNILWF
jgi:hypothetical protein